MLALTIPGDGLSPRERGKRGQIFGIQHGPRSIPAWAGETRPYCRRHAQTPVYPRVGGGNLMLLSSSCNSRGLSPRGWGKPNRAWCLTCRPGSIPAWAGETRIVIRLRRLSMVYPRVGGGNTLTYEVRPDVIGLSPRGRGKRSHSKHKHHHPGSIPAWAGETSSSSGSSSSGSVYPRVGGGNAVAGIGPGQDNGLSPRGRGKRKATRLSTPCNRSIPAWAGETRWVKVSPGTYEVYPRVGGGNATAGGHGLPAGGLSPRGRGKRYRRRARTTRRRSIPAWAGETRPFPCPGRCLEVYPRVGGGNISSPIVIAGA